MTTIGPFQLNTIVTGECSAMMSALPDGCIDLWLTSPPYDNLRSYSGYTFDFEAIAAQLWRVTKPGGVGVWVVGDATENGSETLTSFKQALYFRELGFNVHDTMISEKYGASFPDPARYFQSFEYMFVLSKGTPKAVNLIKDRMNIGWKSKSNLFSSRPNRDGTRTTQRRKPREDYSQRFNIWKYSALEIRYGNDTGHPAPFPDGLARDHILSWSNPGDIVLDPMVGSGTTAKQAHLLGRYYLGFEISAEYCELARRRVATVEAQPFLMPPIVETNGHKPEQPALFVEAA